MAILRLPRLALLVNAFFFSIQLATSTTEVGDAIAVKDTPYWLANIKHQGVAAFNDDNTYTVFRNVKDFGAKGNGQHDDTAAINAAISSGNRCSPLTCQSSTNTTAIVYFPAGTYRISSPIIDYYETQLIGNPNAMPTLKASANFTGTTMLEGNQGTGQVAGNIFYRQVRNLQFDMRAVNYQTALSAIHWPTAQVTSLGNLVFWMSSKAGTQHQGSIGDSGKLLRLTFSEHYSQIYH